MVDFGGVRVVDGVSLSVAAGRALALVGESGSGKSLTALSVLGLLRPPGRVQSGSIRFDGQELLALPEPQLRRVRGAEVAVVFQEPMSALNPLQRVGDQVAEALLVHSRCTRRQARERVPALLERVGLSDPALRARQYPHQLSGGMRQRVVLAMALAAGPRLLIADEPTTALDPTIAAQILALLEAERARGMALLLITHDLGIVLDRCDEVVVLYAGQVVERAATAQLFAQPRHPYTRALLDARPSLARAGQRLCEIPGAVPRLDALPPGCRFAPRCSRVQPQCTEENPPLRVLDGGEVRCFFPLPA